MSPDRLASPRRLGRRFFARPADVVARALLGKQLVHGDRAGLVVETEAYLGAVDQASHARFGPTPRTEVMFGQAGIAYVYLCYGMYDLFNVVTGARGQPEAVLVRALEPIAGIDPSPGIARGPGKLTRALGITRAHDRLDVTVSDSLFLCAGRRVRDDQVAAGPRIGVAYAGAWADEPLRFWLAGHPEVTRFPPRRAPGDAAPRGASR